MIEQQGHVFALGSKVPKNLKQISLQRDTDVQYWSHRLNASRAALEEAVEQVGTNVNAVTDYLSRQK